MKIINSGFPHYQTGLNSSNLDAQTVQQGFFWCLTCVKPPSTNIHETIFLLPLIGKAMMAADGVTVQTLYSRMVLLCTPSETLAVPAIATGCCDRVLPKPIQTGRPRRHGRLVRSGHGAGGSSLDGFFWIVRLASCLYWIPAFCMDPESLREDVVVIAVMEKAMQYTK